MWHDLGHTSNLNLSWDKRGIKVEKGSFFLLCMHERRGESQRIPPKIYGFPLVGFRLAKNKSSSHRRGVLMGNWKEGFLRRTKRGDFGKSKLSDLGGFLLMYHTPISKGFFLH